MVKSKNREVVLDDFLEWVKEDTAAQFKNYEPIGDRILIRLYHFDASKHEDNATRLYTDMGSNKTVNAQLDSQIFSIGKILSIGNGVNGNWESLKVGDLINVPDIYTGSKINKDWVEYQALALEKPGIKSRMEEPAMHIGYLSQWKDFVFMSNKFADKLDMNDAYTFLLPQRYIVSKYHAD